MSLSPASSELQARILQSLQAARPTLWAGRGGNERSSHDISAEAVHQAVARLERFAPLLVKLFPELSASGGRIESELLPIPKMQQALGQKIVGDLRSTLEPKVEKLNVDVAKAIGAPTDGGQAAPKSGGTRAPAKK